MFGGLAFLLNGNMSVAASGQGGLLVRVPPEDTDKLAARAHVGPMVMAGRETRGWLRVDAAGVGPNASLRVGSPAASDTPKACRPSSGAVCQRTPGVREPV